MAFTARWRRGTGAFFGDLGVHADQGRVSSVQPDGMTSFGYSDNDTFTASGKAVSICTTATAITCAGEGPGGVALVGVTYSDDGIGASIANRWIFVASGQEVSTKFHASGWRLRQVPLRYRFTDGAAADTLGLNLAGRSVGVFTSASLAGGTSGSIAQALPPCSNAEAPPIMEGVGQLTLAGGTREESLTCPGLPHGAIASWSARVTTWTARGFAAGSSTLYNTRLLVIDIPRSGLP